MHFRVDGTAASLSVALRTNSNGRADERIAGVTRARPSRRPGRGQLLVDRYSTGVLIVVRRHLDRNGLRRLFDSNDFLQETWAAFFRRAVYNWSFDDPARLVAYLARMAEHKVLDAERQHLDADKRDLRRQVSLASPAGRVANTVADPEVAPDQAASRKEQRERIIREAPAAVRPALALLLAGASQEAIAAELGVDPRTVRRMLALVRKEPA